MLRGLLIALPLLCVAGCGDSGGSPDAGPDAAMQLPDLGPPAPTVLAPAQTLTTCLAADANGVYWADQAVAGNQILKVSIAGGAPTVLAAGADRAACVVIDAQNAYYTVRDTDGGLGDSVIKVALAGGAPAPIATAQHVLHHLVSDGSFVYWITDLYGPGDAMFNGKAAVVRVPVAGGAAPEVLLATVVGNPVGLAVDAANFYYSDAVGVFAYPRAGMGASIAFGMSTIHGNPFVIDGDATHLAMVELTGIGMGDVVLFRLDGMGRVVLSPKLAASPLALDASGVYAKQDNHLVRYSLDGKTTTILTNVAPRALALFGGNVYFTDGASILKLAE